MNDYERELNLTALHTTVTPVPSAEERKQEPSPLQAPSPNFPPFSSHGDTEELLLLALPHLNSHIQFVA